MSRPREAGARTRRPRLRLGADLVSVARVGRLLDRLTPYGARLIFSARERAQLARGAEYAAGRLAVKEALLKATRLGFRGGIRRMSEISTETDPTGAPVVRTRGVVAARLKHQGVRNVVVSVSHERTHAVAVVILTS